MVASTSRMSITTIKRQSINQQKRKCTRADPTQTGILLKCFDAEARPSAEQFVDMSQQTSLPVKWIKKWFLRRRKADGKNRTLVLAEPTFVENEPPACDGQALGHTHSKFWSIDAFTAADSTDFSPSVGYIPKLYGHHGRTLPPENANNDATESQEERAVLSPGTSAETGYGYVTQSDCIPTDENAQVTSPASYDLRKVLLGADALGPRASEHPNVALTIDELFSVVSSPERSAYPDNPFDERLSHSGSITDLELSTTNYSVPSMTSSINTIDDLILVSGDFDFDSTTSCSASDLGLSDFDSTTGCADWDLGSWSNPVHVPGYTTDILDRPSVFCESPLFQGESIDVCLGAAPTATGHELESANALGHTLLNLYAAMCDPTVSVVDLGGFDGQGNGDDVQSVLKVVDSDEGFCSWLDRNV